MMLSLLEKLASLPSEWKEGLKTGFQSALHLLVTKVKDAEDKLICFLF